MSLNFDLLWKYLTPKDCLNVSGWLDNSGIWLPVKAMEKKRTVQMPLITRITGDFFFTVPSLAHSLIKRAPVQLQTFDYTELAIAWSGDIFHWLKTCPWQVSPMGGWFLFSLLYYSTFLICTISPHLHLLRSTSKFLLPGVPGLNCTVHHSWWYLPAQQMLAFQCTERTIQPCATGCTASLVQKTYCTVEMKDTGLLSFWMSQFISSFHGMIAI